MIEQNQDHVDATAYLRRVTASLLDAKKEIALLKEASTEAIAVMSMACHLPGNIHCPDELWKAVLAGYDAIAPFPQRPGWDEQSISATSLDGSALITSRTGGFLDQVAGFDARFFGISPREAQQIDPQQRLLLQTVWEAIERACLHPDSLKGSNTGVFVGIMPNDYAFQYCDNHSHLDGYLGISTLPSTASGRISYILDLHGPSISVDTACSSSLVATHLAMQALRRGECDRAIVGGVTVLPSPRVHVEFSRQGALSPDGRSKAFSENADGFAIAEGVAVLVLERYRDVRAGGRTIEGLLRGSAINQDGRSQGMTAPNGTAQMQVIRQAVRDAGVQLGDIDYVDAHGTGTCLGDPIEAEALINTYGKAKTLDRPLYLGSLKSNIGHTQAAAGIASIIKTILAMQHQVLPKTLHADTPSALIDWSAGAVEFVQDNREWSDKQLDLTQLPTRLAGVSSFGISGTNAHVVLEQAPLQSVDAISVDDESHHPSSARASVPFVVQGHNRRMLNNNARRLAEYLDQADKDCGNAANAAPNLFDISYSLINSRIAQRERALVPACGRRELIENLKTISTGQPTLDSLWVSNANHTHSVMVFSGQGSQHLGMCRELLALPAFSASLQAIDAILQPYIDFSVIEALKCSDTNQAEWLQDVTTIQPLLFATSLALVDAWAFFGVKPAGVVGQSQGEVTAAVVAGALSIEQGARLIAIRSRHVANLQDVGEMYSIGLSLSEVEKLLNAHGDEITVAGVLSHETTVVAGAKGPIMRLVDLMESRGIFHKRILIDYPSHSHFVEPVLAQLSNDLKWISPRKTNIPFYSTVTGTLLSGEKLDAAYWAANLRQTVRLDLAVQSIENNQQLLFIEVSAHPILLSPLNALKLTCIPTLKKDSHSLYQFQSSVMQAFCWGQAVNTDAFYAAENAKVVSLPVTEFDKQNYWYDHTAPEYAAKTQTYHSEKAEFGLYKVDVEPLDLHPMAESDLAELHCLIFTPEKLLAELSQLTSYPPGLIIIVRWPNHTVCAQSAVDQISDALSLLRRWFETDQLRNQKLVLVTQGGLFTDQHTDDANPGAAGLWGAVASAALEYPDSRLILLDCDRELSDSALIEQVKPCIRYESQSGQRRFAIRDKRIHATCLTREYCVHQGPEKGIHTIPEPRHARTNNGTTVITGGLAGIGGALAEHLAARGQKHLLVLSRSGRRDLQSVAIAKEIEARYDVSIELVRCDVANESALMSVINAIPSARALESLYHLAVVYDDALLSNTCEKHIVRIAKPKIIAAWHLIKIVQNRPGIPLVFFSSATGILGKAGQSVYAACNRAIDALAVQFHQQGLPIKSLCWGAWAETGGVSRLSGVEQQRIQSSGVLPVSNEQALKLLDKAMLSDTVVLAPLCLCLDQLQSTAEVDAYAVPALLRTLLSAESRADSRTQHAANDQDQTSAGATLQSRLDALGETELGRGVARIVSQEISLILGFGNLNTIAQDQSLAELGLDSMQSLRARNRLSELFSVPLATTLLFDYPTIEALSAHLTALLESSDRQTPPIPEQEKRQPLHTDPAVKHAARSADTVAHHSRDIAVISMSCRLPGKVNSTEAYWQALVEELDLVAPLASRPGWDFQVTDARSEFADMAKRQAGFIDDIASFDAGFFRISPREATRIDPQQRLLLESTWELIERARIVPSALHGSDTGVYVGVTYNDYYARFINHPEFLDGQLGPGSFASTASGRLSYTFGLNGPALTIDTACSSSLVATHTAVNALRTGDCSLAVAGGVTLHATPASIIEAAKTGGLAPDGRCKAFSDDADGISMSEGCSLVLLARKDYAEAQGYPIIALIKGSACNQDGQSQGLTAPSRLAQEQVIGKALKDAGLRADSVDVLEAHGTGTSLGDPIELSALQNVYGCERNQAAALMIGSVKSNFGHTQAASGVAGLQKMVLALQHQHMPKSLHCNIPTSKIDWSSGTLKVLSHAQEWIKEQGERRRAAVSSFGLSGTNAHIILEEYISQVTQSDTIATTRDRNPYPLIISGRTEKALINNAASIQQYLEKTPDIDLRSLSYSLWTTRTRFEHNLVVEAEDASKISQRLQQYCQGKLRKGVTKASVKKRKLVFVYPGHGSHHLGMLRKFENNAVFNTAMLECDRALRRYLDISVVSLWKADRETQSDSFKRMDQLQPLVFAFAYAMTKVWESLNVKPDAVLGHSQGEIAAAVAAGALSLDDAACLVAARSQLLENLPATGGMANVLLPVDKVQDLLQERWPELSIALVNGARATVIAGDKAVLDVFTRSLDDRDIQYQTLDVDKAGHSPQIDPVLPALSEQISFIKPRPTPDIAFYSTVTGDIQEGETLDAQYWCRNIRQPVRLDIALASLNKDPNCLFLEVASKPVLTSTLMSSGCDAVVPTLRKDVDPVAEWNVSAAILRASGVTIKETALFAEPYPIINLPTYAFDRKHYWLDLPATQPKQAFTDDLNEVNLQAESVSRSTLFSNKQFRQSPQEQQRQVLKQTLCEAVANVLGLDCPSEVSTTLKFIDQGMESILMVELYRQLRHQIDESIPASDLVENPTVDTLVKCLIERLTVSDPASKLDIAECGKSIELSKPSTGAHWADPSQDLQGDRLKLICYPHSGGSSAVFQDWARKLSDDIQLVPLQPPGRWNRFSEKPFRQVPIAAKNLCQWVMSRVAPPYVLLGHSLGASMVFETTRLLQKHGASLPAALVVAARNAPHLSTFIGSQLNFIENANDREIVSLVTKLYGEKRMAGMNNPEFQEMFVPGLVADILATARYRLDADAGPVKLQVPLWAVGGVDDKAVPKADILAWEHYTSELFTTDMFEGDHFFLHSESSGFLDRLITYLATSCDVNKPDNVVENIRLDEAAQS